MREDLRKEVIMKKKIIIMSIVLAGLMFGQILYQEHFSGGAMQLTWHAWFRDSVGVGDSMGVISDPTTPGGDNWAGRVTNEWMGAAGLTYAGLDTLKDYSVDAWIYTRVTSANGPYNGISIRMNPSSRYFYRMVSDFDNSARLRLGFVGSGGMPVVIRDWNSGEIPGGVPAASSWHKFKLTTISDQIWAYYDDVLLPSCPITYDSIANGHFGVYTFNMADTSSTKCDDIVVRAEAWGVEEHGSTAESGLTVYPNPFTNNLTIKFQIPNSKSEMSLKIYNATGRLVKSLNLPTTYSMLPTAAHWDGTDDSGKRLAPGIYFVTDRQTGAMVKAIKID
jgi:hypothetical protein